MEMREVPYPEESVPKHSHGSDDREAEYYPVTNEAQVIIKMLSKRGHVNEDGAIIYTGDGKEQERTGSDVFELVNYRLGYRFQGKPIDYKLFMEQFGSYFETK